MKTLLHKLKINLALTLVIVLELCAEAFYILADMVSTVSQFFLKFAEMQSDLREANQAKPKDQNPSC